ncbi:hypothetical protein EC991_008803 [Linnemannia zychae]|nr:hypothetical protein EC991_008803 [Linnemannia zychae]
MRTFSHSPEPSELDMLTVSDLMPHRLFGMDSFKEFSIKDTHNHADLAKMYSCYTGYVSRQRSTGPASDNSDKSKASSLGQAEADSYQGKLDGSIFPGMAATTTTTTTSATSTADTTIDKVTTPSTAALKIKDGNNRPEEEMEGGQGKRHRVSFGSTVSATTSTSTSGSLYLNHRSETSSELNIKDLMALRDRIAQENYGISQPHEMFVVNFIFLMVSENQTGGMQGEVQDHVWESVWDCVKTKIINFESTTIVEGHKWAVLAAVLMEGKTAANKGSSLVWDDLTKLGQE